MTKALTLYELTGSPNNVKVRIALGVKGLEYERIPIEIDPFPGNRSIAVELSGQPRLPVLKHGETVIYDSRGILRYLDANFRDTHELFTSDYQQMGEIEGWELYASTLLGAPVGLMFQQVLSGSPEPSACAKASKLMHEATERIEDALEGQEYLLGDRLKAPDVVCAPVVNLAMLLAGGDAGSPIHAAFRKHFHLGKDRERTRAWTERVMSHDPVYRAMR